MARESVTPGQIEKLMSLSEDRLYLSIGYQLISEDTLEAPPSEDIYGLQPDSVLKVIERGKQLVAQYNDAIYDRICVEFDYCAKRNDPELSDNVTLVAWVVDAITSVLLRSPLVVATVAVILVKKGLILYCKCSDSPKPTETS